MGKRQKENVVKYNTLYRYLISPGCSQEEIQMGTIKFLSLVIHCLSTISKKMFWLSFIFFIALHGFCSFGKQRKKRRSGERSKGNEWNNF